MRNLTAICCSIPGIQLFKMRYWLGLSQLELSGCMTAVSLTEHAWGLKAGDIKEYGVTKAFKPALRAA